MTEETKAIIGEIREVGKLLNDRIEEVRTELKTEIEGVRQNTNRIETKLDKLTDEIEYIRLKTDVIETTIKLHDTDIHRLKFDISRLKKAETI